MSKQRGSPIVGSAQDVGGAVDGAQRERVRTGPVQTADGKRILLSVVAAGTDSGESAARVVEQVFQSASGAQAANVGIALKRGLEIASQGLARRGSEVAAAAVAIRRSRVFFANVGNNAVFRVAGQEAIRLTRASNIRLGAEGALRIQAGPEAGLTLRSGDRVVIASAGVLESSPADGKPFVDPKAIPAHIKNLPPEDAAKHLVSIALGRDVGSNVTVAVLGEVKERRRWPVAALVVAGLMGATLLILGALALIGSPDPEATTDFGFAVLVRGGVLADTGDGAPNIVGILDTIPAGAALTAQTDAVLGLQTTYEASTNLTRSNVYMENGAVLRLSAIDPRGNNADSGQTRLGLDEGSILVSRQSGTWEYRVLFIGNESILSGAGPAAMGVDTSGGGLQIDCLIGVCLYSSGEGDELLLSGGERIRVGISSGIVQESAIPPESIARWNELCGGCVQGNP
ncbi:MAG: hypothetical protein BMS9Abin28_2407 [Anaerolineae bacterium]|nr:MAG: hypothetical protein BMS9Abin28_2407 [Anaerolineae bacterium]